MSTSELVNYTTVFILSISSLTLITTIVCIVTQRQRESVLEQYKPIRYSISGVVLNCLVSCAYYVLGLPMIVTFFNVLDLHWLIVVFVFLFACLGFFFLFDLPIFLNHLFHELSHQMSFDEKSILSVVKKGKEQFFDLDDPNTELLIYEPEKSKSLTNKFPGQDFGKYILKNEKGSCEFSEMIIEDNWPFNIFINKMPKTVIKKKQFNFFWK